MKSQYMFHRIRKLNKEGRTKTHIAKEMGMDRKTVSKYLLANTPPEYKKRETTTRSDPFAPYEELVISWLMKNQLLSGPEIFELLIENGYNGSLRTVKRRLQKLKNPKENERFFQQNYQPGEQSQFDFKEKVSIPFWKEELIVYLHYSTLPHSNKFFIRAYPSKNFECFIDGIHEFFQHIGGITQNIRIDNLSPCVSKVLSGTQRKYTDAFNKAIEYYGFGVLPCSPGKGNEKGDVERDIQTHTKRITNAIQLQDLKFENFSDLNNWLSEYCKKRTNEKIQDAFINEQPSLQRMIDKKEGITSRTFTVTANSYGTVQWDKLQYSVPDKAIGHKCEIILGTENLKIKMSATGEVIATHPLNKKTSILLQHVLPSLTRKPGAMVRWSHKDALFPEDVYHTFYLSLKKTTSWRAEQDYLKIINLIHHTDYDELTVAISLALESGEEDLCQKVRDLLLIENRPNNVLQMEKQLGQKELRPALKNYDELIPGEINDASTVG